MTDSRFACMFIYINHTVCECLRRPSSGCANSLKTNEATFGFRRGQPVALKEANAKLGGLLRI